MAEMGQVRNVDCLFLLTLSSPATLWDAKMVARLEGIANSFAVP